VLRDLPIASSSVLLSQHGSVASKHLETPRIGFAVNVIDLLHVSMHAVHPYMAEAVRLGVRVGFTDVVVALRQTLKHVTEAYALPTDAEIAKYHHSVSRKCIWLLLSA
jgi:hypothetical protein